MISTSCSSPPAESSSPSHSRDTRASAMARVSREWEGDDDSAGGDEQEVEIILSGGSALRGTLRFLQPPGRARLQDYLNDAPPFLRLAQDTEVVLVNKQHVARVSKVK